MGYKPLSDFRERYKRGPDVTENPPFWTTPTSAVTAASGDAVWLSTPGAAPSCPQRRRSFYRSIQGKGIALNLR